MMQSEFKMRHRVAYRILFVFMLIVTFRIFWDLVEYRHQVAFIKDNIVPKNTDRRKVNLGPKVSIIIPAKNEAKMLPLLLKSLTCQTYSNMEILVADCKSTDGTDDIARQFGARVIGIPKSSVGYACSTAVKESSGSIIIRTDADNIFLPNHVERIVRIFISKGPVNVIYNSNYYYDTGFILKFLSFLYNKYWRPLYIAGGMIAIRRDFYFDIGGYADMRYGEDTDLGLRIVNRCDSQCIFMDRQYAVMQSARAIRKSGIFSYLMQSAGISFSISN